MMPIYCKGKGCAGRKKYASYGLKGGKRQWCGPCAKRHGSVLLVKHKMCEGWSDAMDYNIQNDSTPHLGATDTA